jgi:hypothetical protein
MDPAAYASTVARLADAVPRDGAIQIAQVLLDQLQLAPPVRRRRLRLPSMADLRRMSRRRLRLPAVRARQRIRGRAARLRLNTLRQLPHWRKSRRTPK